MDHATDVFQVVTEADIGEKSDFPRPCIVQLFSHRIVMDEQQRIVVFVVICVHVWMGMTRFFEHLWSQTFTLL